MLTADHGCDPAAPHTDHTREHAPLLAVFAGHGGRRHDGPLADVGASVLRWLTAATSPAAGAPVRREPERQVAPAATGRAPGVSAASSV